MVQILAGARVDLAAFGLLVIALVALHAGRTRHRDWALLTHAYRGGLWLVLWQGASLLLRLTGFA